MTYRSIVSGCVSQMLKLQTSQNVILRQIVKGISFALTGVIHKVLNIQLIAQKNKKLVQTFH